MGLAFNELASDVCHSYPLNTSWLWHQNAFTYIQCQWSEQLYVLGVESKSFISLQNASCLGFLHLPYPPVGIVRYHCIRSITCAVLWLVAGGEFVSGVSGHHILVPRSTRGTRISRTRGVWIFEGQIFINPGFEEETVLSLGELSAKIFFKQI